MSYNKRPSMIRFIFLHSWVQIIIAIIILIVYHNVGRWQFLKDIPFEVKEWLEIYIPIITLIIAIYLWVNEKVKEWQSSLPKKLNIQYFFEGKEYATVVYAPLAGEGDIRNWGQSIAQTILNTHDRIHFSGFDIKAPKRQKNIMLYDLTIFLNRAINGIGANSKFVFGEDGNLKESFNTSQASLPVILNSAILTDFGSYDFKPLKINGVKALLKNGYESFIGHESTAEVLSTLLDLNIPCNRAAYLQRPGETALVFKLKNRITAGTVLQTPEEIEAVGYDFGLLKRIQ